MDAVAPHDTRLGVHDEQQVEFFQAVGQTRQESLSAPGLQRRLIRF